MHVYDLTTKASGSSAAPLVFSYSIASFIDPLVSDYNVFGPGYRAMKGWVAR